jgi:hypothetical protein
MLRRDALFTAAEPRQITPLFELFDRRRQRAFSSVRQPPLSRLALRLMLLPRGVRRVNRAHWRLLQCNNSKFPLTSIRVSEP